MPVDGHGNLIETIGGFVSENKFSVFVLINCGAMIDLTRWQSEADKPTYKVWLLDSHRPILHTNLAARKHVYLVDDGTVEADACPQPADLRLLEEAEQPEEAEPPESQEGLGRRRQRAERAPPATKRQIDEARARVEAYYRESYTGKSVSGLLYALCQQMHFDSNSTLWLWIIGLTTQFIGNRISPRQYEREVLEIQREVLRLNLRSISPSDARPNTFASARRIGSISLEKDLNLALMRHWTLYDSLLYSARSAAQLRTWNEIGRRELRKLIAKLGVPLTEAQQKFGCLNPKYREPLRERMVELSEEFGLSNVYVSAFLFCVDHRTTMSSLDVAAAVRAVLAYRGCFHTLVMQGERPGEAPRVGDNFWCVFHQLLDRDTAFFAKAVQLGIEQQKRVASVCFEAVEKRLIKALPGFKCVVLEQEAQANGAAFGAEMLEQFGQMFGEICRAQSKAAKTSRNEPLLLAMLDKAAEAYHIISVETNGGERGDSSSFGGALKEAAETAQTRYSSDSFNSALIKVHSKDFESFFEALRAQFV